MFLTLFIHSCVVVVKMPYCPIEDGNVWYVALLQSQNTSLPTLTSQSVKVDSVSTIIITGLKKKLLYSLTIVSNNSLGTSSSESLNFCK